MKKQSDALDKFLVDQKARDLESGVRVFALEDAQNKQLSVLDSLVARMSDMTTQAVTERAEVMGKLSSLEASLVQQQEQLKLLQGTSGITVE